MGSQEIMMIMKYWKDGAQCWVEGLHHIVKTSNMKYVYIEKLMKFSVAQDAYIERTHHMLKTRSMEYLKSYSENLKKIWYIRFNSLSFAFLYYNAFQYKSSEF